MPTTEGTLFKIDDPTIRSAFGRAVRAMYLAGATLDKRSAEAAGSALDDLVRSAGGTDREGWHQLVSAAAVAGPDNWPADIDDRPAN